MVNWQDLPAGLDLDRVIAYVLGYSDVELRIAKWDGPDDVYQEEYLLGNLNERNPQRIPFYSTDANAALALISDMPPDLKFNLEIWKVDNLDFKDGFWRDLRGKLFYLAMFFVGEGEDEVHIAHKQADAPALAICRAWLDWKAQRDA